MNEIPERIESLTPERKALFQQLLLGKKKESVKNASIEIRSERDHLPLSFGQMRLWFLDQLEPGNHLYNLTTALKLEGTLNKDALENSFTEITRRHEVLRTTFQKTDGDPRQVISSPAFFVLPVTDLSGVPEKEQESALDQAIDDELRTPFDLSRGPLFRARLFRLDSDVHVLLTTMHHIVSDGWSMGLYVEELAACYKAFARNETPGLPPLSIQYADFAAWQRKYMSGERLASDMAYWEKKLAGAPSAIDLPFAKKRPEILGFSGSTAKFHIGAELAQKISQTARDNSATLFMTLLTAFAVLLHRYTEAEDIVIGSPVANRNLRELEQLIGFFVNTVVLRMDLSDNPSFREMLQRVKKTSAEAFDHQETPFEKLVETLKPERNLGRTPLFQIMFVLQNAPLTELELPGLTIERFEIETVSAQFDLVLSVVESPEGLYAGFEYNTELFDEHAVRRMCGHFQTLVEHAVNNPDCPVTDLEILTDEEKELIFHRFNDTRADFPEEKTIVDIFSEQVSRSPREIAVYFGQQKLSYRELDEKTDALARELIALGTEKHQPVGVLIHRSQWIPIALLGIMKAGAVYVPIDPVYPPERIEYMLKDSDCKIVLTEEAVLNQKHFDTLVNESFARFVDIHKIHKNGKQDLLPSLNPENTAYIIYTSGSTGTPKGVMLAHRGFVNMILSQIRQLGVKPEDRVLQFASASFDGSLYEIFSALFSGASLVCVTSDEIKDPETLVHTMKEYGVTMAAIPPTYLKVIGFHNLRHLRILITAGESAISDEGLFSDDNHHYWNLYGPTESSVTATSYRIEKEAQNGNVIPIGKPIDNMQAWIMNPVLSRLQPVGVPGEICLSGTGLAKGYLNKPEMTAGRFVPHPLEPEKRIYRTGDLGAWLSDGNIRYVGRNDDQVKIRGFRIEPGEIENRLLELDAVNEAVVLARPVTGTDPELTAYVTLGEDYREEINVEMLRSRLLKTLPDYMIPSYFVQLDSMPLTPNKKIDKRALPHPGGSRMSGEAKYVPPRNEMEKAVVSAWSQVLGRGKIGIRDNYFAIGGDSIKSIQVSSRLLRMGLKMEIRDLFQYPTPAELALHLTQAKEPTEKGKARGIVPLTAVQKWFFERIETDRHHFNQSILLKGLPRFDENVLKTALEEIQSHHDALRLRYDITDDMVVQRYADEVLPLDYLVVDLRGKDEQVSRMEAHNDRHQAGMDLKHGPLMRTVLYRLDDADRLLITIHHLVVDAVSLRILLEDLTFALTQVGEGKPVLLPPKTASFQEWAEEIYTFSVSEELKNATDYWRNIIQIPELVLPSDITGGEGLNRDAKIVGIDFTEKETERFLSEGNRMASFFPETLLFAGLGETIHKWTGKKEFAVITAGHGRESVVGDIDVSRTVGWFSSMYPVPIRYPYSGKDNELPAEMEITQSRSPQRGLG